MTEATQDGVGQNNTVKLLVVVVLLAAASFGAYKFAAARSNSQANVQWAAEATPQAGINEFLPHVHPPGYVHPKGTYAGGTTIGPSGAPLAQAAQAPCPMGNGPKADTINGITGDSNPGTAKIIQGVQ